MKKILVVVIMGILFCAVVYPVFGNRTIQIKPQLQPTLKYPDEVDQKQETYIPGVLVPVGTLSLGEVSFNVQVAQSFIPQKEILTRVELYIGKNTTTTYPYHVAIRDALSGENLAESNVNAVDIPTQNFSWVEFDIPDLWVNISRTYYIVCSTQNTSDNWYIWAANNDSASYQQGCAWVSLDGNNWSNQSAAFDLQKENFYTPINSDDTTWDMCFRTYGLQATSLHMSLHGIIFPTLTIQNIGMVPAYDVTWNVDVQSMFSPVKHYEGSIAELSPGDSIHTRLLLIGLGKVIIHATAEAANAPQVTLDVEGLLILIFFIQK
ncbi:MAG: hypothetical protein QXX20_06825 [Candidatus Thermoplasmatota archaeon]